MVPQIITQQWVDLFVPQHDRTSCNDLNPCNGSYDIAEDFLQGVVIQRRWEKAPRCNRCFFLNLIGDPIPYRLKVDVSVNIEPRQPKITVKSEG